MNKTEFLDALDEKLSGFPQDEVQERISFYCEMIDDRVEDGMSEADAVAQIGTVDEIVDQIMSDIPLSKLVREKVSSKKKRKTWQTVLLAVGAVVWVPLLIAAAAVIFSLYIALWAVAVSLYAVFLALAAAGVCGIPGAVVLLVRGNIAGAALTFGAGIICAGLAILMFFVCVLVTRGVVKLTGKMLKKTKSLFVRKGDRS